MKQLIINPNNEPYYSEDFIKGFKCGAERQFEADKSDADRPQGEWIEQEDCWQCSECGDEYVLEVGVKPIDARMHYCPNCGARMKGADDE